MRTGLKDEEIERFEGEIQRIKLGVQGSENI